MGDDEVDDAEMREAVLSGTRALIGLAARSLPDGTVDVSLAQFRVLVLLDGRSRLTMTELAANLDVSPSTVTRMCDVLVDRCLIRRVSSLDNRRVVWAELAAGGRRLIDQVMSRRRLLVDEALARMTPAGRRRLARSLAEFAEAAGELSDHAWLLGWSLDEDETA